MLYVILGMTNTGEQKKHIKKTALDISERSTDGHVTWPKCLGHPAGVPANMLCSVWFSL